MDAFKKVRDKKGSKSTRRRNLIKDIQALQSKHLEAKIVMAKEEMALKHTIKMERASLKELEGKLLEKGGKLGETKAQRKALKEQEEEKRKQDVKPWQVHNRVQNTRLRLQERLINDQVLKLGKDIISKKKHLSKLCKRLSTMLNQPAIGSINWTPMGMMFKEPYVPTPSVFYPKPKTPIEDDAAVEETIQCQEQVAYDLVDCEHSTVSDFQAMESTDNTNNNTIDTLLSLDEEDKKESFCTSVMKPSLSDPQAQKIAANDVVTVVQKGARLSGCFVADPWTSNATPTNQRNPEVNEATPIQPYYQVRHSLQQLEINPFASVGPVEKKEASACLSYAEIYGMPLQEIKSKAPQKRMDKNSPEQNVDGKLKFTGFGMARGGNLINVRPIDTVRESHEMSMVNSIPADYYMPDSTIGFSSQFLNRGGMVNSNNNGSQSGSHCYRACTDVASRTPAGFSITGQVDWSEAVKEFSSMGTTTEDSAKYTPGRVKGAVMTNDMHVEDLD